MTRARMLPRKSKAQAKQIDGLQKKLVTVQAKFVALPKAEGTDAAKLDEVPGYDVQIREIKVDAH